MTVDRGAVDPRRPVPEAVGGPHGPTERPVREHAAIGARLPGGSIFRVGYLLLCMTLLLFALEAVVRWRGLAPFPSPRNALYAPDPVLPYRLRPAAVVTG